MGSPLVRESSSKMVVLPRRAENIYLVFQEDRGNLQKSIGSNWDLPWWQSFPARRWCFQKEHRTFILSSKMIVVISRRVEDSIGISPGDRVFQQDGGTLKKSRNSFEYRVKFVNIISFPQERSIWGTSWGRWKHIYSFYVKIEIRWFELSLAQPTCLVTKLAEQFKC